MDHLEVRKAKASSTLDAAGEVRRGGAELRKRSYGHLLGGGGATGGWVHPCSLAAASQGTDWSLLVVNN